jgi:hypothetical protein
MRPAFFYASRVPGTGAVKFVEIRDDSRAMADEVERDRFQPFEIPPCHGFGTVEAVLVGRIDDAALKRKADNQVNFLESITE